jgi:hypothetical protein
VYTSCAFCVYMYIVVYMYMWTVCIYMCVCMCGVYVCVLRDKYVFASGEGH